MKPILKAVITLLVICCIASVAYLMPSLLRDSELALSNEARLEKIPRPAQPQNRVNKALEDEFLAKPQAQVKKKGKRKTKMVQIAKGGSGVAGLLYTDCEPMASSGILYGPTVSPGSFGPLISPATGWTLGVDGSVAVPLGAALGYYVYFRTDLSDTSCSVGQYKNNYYEFQVVDEVGDDFDPTRTSAQVNSNGEVEITFSEAITGSTGFTINVDEYDKSLGNGGIVSTSIATDVITLVMNVPIKIGQIVTDAYGGGDIEDLSGNELESYAAESVTNNSNLYNSSMNILL